MKNSKKTSSSFVLALIIVASLSLASCFSSGYRYGGPARYNYGYGYNRPYVYNYGRPYYSYNNRRSTYGNYRHNEPFNRPNSNSNRAYSYGRGGNGGRGSSRGGR